MTWTPKHKHRFNISYAGSFVTADSAEAAALLVVDYARDTGSHDDDFRPDITLDGRDLTDLKRQWIGNCARGVVDDENGAFGALLSLIECEVYRAENGVPA